MELETSLAGRPFTFVPNFVQIFTLIHNSFKSEADKSRADLWAFAATIAVEWGIERNNAACEGKDFTGPTKTQNCSHLRFGENDCKIRFNKLFKRRPDTTIPIRFLTGRRDCSPCSSSSCKRSWMTDQEEVQPNAQGSGRETADFFRENFGRSGREGAALLVGAHSYGEFHHATSMFKYDWTRAQDHLLNNQLFRHLAMRPQYFSNCRTADNPICSLV